MPDMPAASADDSSAGMRPAVLILVGVPGAGKSTFSAALQAASPGRWERVNQVMLSGPLAATCDVAALRSCTHCSN